MNHNNNKSLELLTEIQKAIDRNLVVVVEGMKDKSALEELGFENKNIIVFQGKAIYKRLEEIISKAKKSKAQVIILTDLDRKGKQFYTQIKKELAREGIKVNDKLRELLFKEKLSHIEGLATFIKNLQH